MKKTLSEYDFYSFVIIPNAEQRKKAKENFFDTSLLRFDTKKLNRRAANPMIKEKCEQLKEIIRRINNQLMTANLSLLTLYAYYEEMQRYYTSNLEAYTITEVLFRSECKRVCFEYYSIKENYKTIIRFVYKIDSKAKSDKKFLETVEPLCKRDCFLKKYYSECIKLSKNKHYEFICSIRNDETHNIPCLDNYCSYPKFDEMLYLKRSIDYKIKSKKLFDELKKAFVALISIKNATQNVIDHYLIDD